MKNISFIVLLLLLPTQFIAQTGIGTTSPNDATRLHIAVNNQGVLLPRMNLQSKVSFAPLTAAPPEGTLVFNLNVANTGENKLFQGYYTWLNNKWVRPSQGEVALQPIIQYTKSVVTPILNFNSLLLTPIDIFATEKFSYDAATAYTKLTNSTLRFNEAGTYEVTLNLALRESNLLTGESTQNNNIEFYVYVYLDGVEQKRVLSRVPQWRYGDGSDINGRFDMAFNTYITANAGQILTVRTMRYNTASSGGGTVYFDSSTNSSVTVIKLK